MPSGVKPAFKVVRAGESIEFEAVGVATWELDPVTGGGILGATSGVYVAPPLITATQTAKVTAKDADGHSLGESILQLRIPDLEVVPDRIKLKAGQHAQFTIEPKAYAREVTWTLQSGSPGRLTDSGAYTAPDHIASDQQAHVTAIWQNLHSSAMILLLAEKVARNILIGYWVLVIAG